MPQNRTDLSPAERDADFAQQFRANAAFENTVVGVLAGAAVCCATFFVLTIAIALFDGAALTTVVLRAVFSALVIACLYFLIGFGAGALLAPPLYKSLETAKRRSGWPYAGAGFGVALAALIGAGAVRGAMPGHAAIAAVMLSTGATIFIFARRMQPVWRAAAAADAAAEDAGTMRLN